MSRVLPVLFNTDMVQAVLDGRKTSTRRVVKGDIILTPEKKHRVTFFPYKPRKDRGIEIKSIKYCTSESLVYSEAPYHPGDILYVRETWAFLPCIECMGEGEGCGRVKTTYEDRTCETEGCFVYRADHPHPDRVSWSPSIHMPKEAARIWLKVTDVRVERLQDIEYIFTEGIHLDFCPKGYTWKNETDMHNCYTDEKGAMEALWNSTIKKGDIDIYGWKANPWVWVIEFERCEKPEPCIIRGVEPAEDERPCIGYGVSEDDDEPCEMCKRCRVCSGNY